MEFSRSKSLDRCMHLHHSFVNPGWVWAALVVWIELRENNATKFLAYDCASPLMLQLFAFSKSLA